jgi:hypothetical protein
VELVAIIGERLSAVTFVQDYVQLHFDGPTLTAITRPTVVVADVCFDYGDAGYRDELCALIGQTVKHATVAPHDALRVEFSDGRSFVISLRPDAYRAAEAVVYTDENSAQWASW